MNAAAKEYEISELLGYDLQGNFNKLNLSNYEFDTKTNSLEDWCEFYFSDTNCKYQIDYDCRIITVIFNHKYTMYKTFNFLFTIENIIKEVK